MAAVPLAFARPFVSLGHAGIGLSQVLVAGHFGCRVQWRQGRIGPRGRDRRSKALEQEAEHGDQRQGARAGGVHRRIVQELRLLAIRPAWTEKTW